MVYAIIQDNIFRKSWRDPNLIKKYTIGTIIDFKSGTKSPPRFIYRFTVNNIKIEASHLITSSLALKNDEELKLLIGKRYYVKFIDNNGKKPNFGKLLIKEPVPNKIIKCPKNGWNKMPK